MLHSLLDCIRSFHIRRRRCAYLVAISKTAVLLVDSLIYGDVLSILYINFSEFRIKDRLFLRIPAETVVGELSVSSGVHRRVDSFPDIRLVLFNASELVSTLPHHL